MTEVLLPKRGFAPLRIALAVGSFALLCAAPGFAAAAGTETCPRTPPPQAVSLPHLRAALRGNEPVVIVMLGSSSTQGAMASDGAHNLPALLQEGLIAALPRTHVAVVNRGIRGQDADEEVARLDRDVISVRPQLVIWQVGANAVLRRSDPEGFGRTVEAGVKRLQEGGADVVLLDNQRAPQLLALPRHEAIERTLLDVAAATGASLFSRSALMDQWRAAGYPYEAFIASDGLHHNDLGYRCVAEALAKTIVAATGPSMAASVP
jgi:lysophospholipase L1-like esterase